MATQHLDESGQTFIEYIFMILLVSGLFTFFYQRIGGELTIKGALIQGLNKQFQYNYRHAFYGKKVEVYPPDYSSGNHESYHINGETRFFGPADRYPN